ncbi:MAG: hypothetical protein HY959_02415 [Ignavibacteriae bacterium]|nr:hypothetical protein [Ignavibacteriota bacterium]
MRYYKILKLLNSLEKGEFSKFRSFSSSVYYCRSRDYSGILNAVDYFKRNGIKPNNYSVRDFYSLAYPGKNYNNKTLRNRLNELTKIFEKYIIAKELEGNYHLNKLLLLKGLNGKKLAKIFEQEYKKVKMPKDTEDKSQLVSELKMQNVYYHREQRNFNRMFEELNRQIDYTLINFLEVFFLGAVEYEIEKTYNINPTVNLLFDIMVNLKTDKLIKILEMRNSNSYLITILNYYLYKSISERINTEWFSKFRNILFKNLEKLTDPVKDRYFGYMITYYFLMINSGYSEYLKDVFRLYKLKLRLGLFSELREIRYPSSAFRDYVVVGIRLKKFKWVEEFIRKYSNEVPEEIREEEICLAYSRLYFTKRQFEQAIDLLNKMKSSNYLYILDASRTKLRIFYEISEFEEAFLEIDRIKHYMKNNPGKVARPVRNYTKEFLDRYHTLLKLRLSPDKNELKYFAPQISESRTLVSKEWFMEKVKEMQQFSKRPV